MDKLSIFDAIFSKDDGDDSADYSGRKGFYTKEFSGSMTKRFQRLLSRPIFRFSRSVADFLSHISARVYGATFFTLGFFSMVMYFLGFSFDNTILTPIIGGVICLISILLLIFDKPLPILLQDFAVTDYVFFEFFCMKRHNVLDSQRSFPLVFAVAIGFIPAIISAFVPLWQIALVIVIIVSVYVGMESPEFIFLLSLFALPYLRYVDNYEIGLVIAVALCAISFARKVVYGKRVVCVEQYDIFLGLMMLFVLISGIFLKGVESFSGSVEMIVLALGYMLAGNIITNRRLAERAINAIVISASFAALISIGQLAYLLLTTIGTPTLNDFSGILAREDGISVFFIAATVFSFGMIKQYGKLHRTIYTTVSILCILGVVVSGEFFAFITLLIAGVVYIVLQAQKGWIFAIPVLLFTPLLLLILPDNILNMLFYYSPSIVSAERLYELWSNSFTVFINNFFVGVGIGSESFAEEMANLGMAGFADSSNLLIEIGLEAGVFALLCFISMLLTRLRHRNVQYLYVKNSQMKSLVGISGSCLFCLLAFGMLNYIWSDPCAYYLFWCIFGIGSALLRVVKKDFADKVLYYEEASALDSSVIDIQIG